MADLPLSRVKGSALGVRVVSHENGTIASGVTGDILIINSPDESKAVRLFLLICSSTGEQAGISLIVDGNAIFSAQTLSQSGSATNSGRFRVSRGYSTISSGDAMVLNEVAGRSIVINKNAGNTSQAIVYAYEIIEELK